MLRKERLRRKTELRHSLFFITPPRLRPDNPDQDKTTQSRLEIIRLFALSITEESRLAR